MGEQQPISGRVAMGLGALFALGSALAITKAVYNRHFDDGIVWTDIGNLIKVDWGFMRGWRPQWWQGWLWWTALMLGGWQAVRIGRRIRRAEVDRDG